MCSGRAGKLMGGRGLVRMSPLGSVHEAVASPLHLVVSVWEHGTRVARYYQFSRVFGNLRTKVFVICKYINAFNSYPWVTNVKTLARIIADFL